MKTEEEIREKIKKLDEMAVKSYQQGLIDASRTYNWGITLLDWVLEDTECQK